MFEDAIVELDAMGVSYTEGEDGTLTIDVESVDKTDLITIITFLNDNGLDYTIDAVSIVVSGGAPLELEVDEAVPAADLAMEDLGF